MIPYESAWFSRACKATSLWVVLCQGTAKGLHLRRQGMCLYMDIGSDYRVTSH